MAWLILLLIAVTHTNVQSKPGTDPRDPARPIGAPRFCSDEGDACFSYSRNSFIGPSWWFNVCQVRPCFFGLNQSPVYINPATAVRLTGDFPRLGYSNQTTTGKLIHEGIYPSVEEIKGVRLNGVPGLPSRQFDLTAMHIHFRGGDDNIGTEHRISSKDYDAELHIINKQGSAHWKKVNTEYGLAVIAVFLSLSEGEPSTELNKILEQLRLVNRYKYLKCRNTNELPSWGYFWSLYTQACPAEERGCVRDRCDEVELKFEPDKLMPDRRDFYYYYGSLTTPPLSESVTWLVLDQPIRITESQLVLLQSLESRDEGVPIFVKGNVRPFQALNGRPIYANFHL